jgi:hypothetical protein
MVGIARVDRARGGRRIQRFFAAPSLQSGYCGSNAITSLATWLIDASAYRPVAASSFGIRAGFVAKQAVAAASASIDATPRAALARCTTVPREILTTPSLPPAAGPRGGGPRARCDHRPEHDLEPGLELRRLHAPEDPA